MTLYLSLSSSLTHPLSTTNHSTIIKASIMTLSSLSSSSSSSPLFRQVIGVSILFLLSLTSIQCHEDDDITPLSSSSTSQEGFLFYTASDSASWAVTSDRLSPLLGSDKQVLYDDFIEGCTGALLDQENKRNLERTGKNTTISRAKYHNNKCAMDDQYRLRMNRDQPSSVYNFTKLGYTKIRTPPALFKLVHDFWTQNKDKAEIEWKDVNTFHNTWDAPPTIAHVNQVRSGGSNELQALIWKEAQPILEEWTGQYLSPVSLYGIRSYHNGSILSPHVDRMPLVTSAISTYFYLFMSFVG
jgi:hypothetical protein